jgi:PAS domain S-box-containing protein
MAKLGNSRKFANRVHPNGGSEEVETKNPNRVIRPILAMLPPLVAFVVQWMFWSTIRPYVWFLFYPAVFFSSWIGGLPSGLIATVICTALVWWTFIPPEYSFTMKSPRSLLSVAVFMGMGVLFSFFHGRLRKANKQAAQALAAANSANDQLEDRVKERTASLRKSEERHRSTLDNMLEGCQIIDFEFRYVYANDVAANQGYLTKEELLGHTMMQMYPGIEKSQMFVKLRQCMEERLPQRMENEFIFSDGTKRWFYLSMEPVPEGAFVLSVDITKEKELDEELRKYREHLEDLVKERTTQLEAANKELETFSYSVSHDLRAPLRSIDGFSQALLKDYNEKLDEQGKDFLRRVRSASQRMARLIDDLLKLSRVTRAEMRRERVALSTIAREIADEFRKTHPERRVEFIIADGLVDHGDSQLLRAVMENLLGNSWKYTGKNPAARIEFGVTRDESQTAYYVRDNGVGFDMAYAGKLFGAFQRLHSTAEFEGTGIGLATVQRIIHRHGGRVWAEGKINEGATFYFSL